MADKKLLFLGTGGVSDAVRLVLPARELSKKGIQVEIRGLPENQKTDDQLRAVAQLDSDYDAVLFSRPHSPRIMEILKAKKLYVVIDLDDDFHSIPKSHPGYKHVGPGNPNYLLAVETCVAMADMLTVTSGALRERWKDLAPDTLLIPNGWSKDNPFWGMTYPRETVNVGWGGTITHRNDFELARNALIRTANENAEMRVVIAGDPEIYQKLSKIPEKQKMFVPHMGYEEYPHTLGYFDILLAPLLDDEFNRAKSDVKLVDAGASRIPFIASPTPQYRGWQGGGCFAETPQEWYSAITELVQDPQKRLRLAEACYQGAQSREMARLIYLWEQALL